MVMGWSLVFIGVFGVVRGWIWVVVCGYWRSLVVKGVFY